MKMNLKMTFQELLAELQFIGAEWVELGRGNLGRGSKFNI